MKAESAAAPKEKTALEKEAEPQINVRVIKQPVISKQWTIAEMRQPLEIGRNLRRREEAPVASLKHEELDAIIRQREASARTNDPEERCRLQARIRKLRERIREGQ